VPTSLLLDLALAFSRARTHIGPTPAVKP